MPGECVVDRDIDNGFARLYLVSSQVRIDCCDKSWFTNVHAVTTNSRADAIGRYLAGVSGLVKAESAVMGFSHNGGGEHMRGVLLRTGDKLEKVIDAP